MASCRSCRQCRVAVVGNDEIGPSTAADVGQRTYRRMHWTSGARCAQTPCLLWSSLRHPQHVSSPTPLSDVLARYCSNIRQADRHRRSWTSSPWRQQHRRTASWRLPVVSPSAVCTWRSSRLPDRPGKSSRPAPTPSAACWTRPLHRTDPDTGCMAHTHVQVSPMSQAAPHVAGSLLTSSISSCRRVAAR